MKTILYYLPILILASIGTVCSQNYSGGKGTAENPYQISTLEDLRYLSEKGESDWDKHFILMNDIDAGDTKNWNDGAGFLPIGEDEKSPFTGTFDGNSFAIDSLYINKSKIYSYGFFGVIGNSESCAEISNLGITNCTIKGREYANGGAIAGTNSNGIIQNCYAIVDISDMMVAGGLIGYNGSYKGKGNVNNSYVLGKIKADIHCGGIVGYHFGGTISNSYTNIDIIVDIEEYLDLYPSAGGIVGTVEYNLQMSNCHSKGSIFTNSHGGGIVGRFGEGAVVCQIHNSFSECSVKSHTDNAKIGGLVGHLGPRIWTGGPYTKYPKYIRNCYSKGEVRSSGKNSSIGGLVGHFEKLAFIKNCYSATKVIGIDRLNDIGGFIGFYDYSSHGDVNYCCFDKEISNDNFGIMASPLTTAQMKTKSTYVNQSWNWDFDNIWDIDGVTNEGYPFLRPDALVDWAGIEDESEPKSENLTIYPNPAQNHITINHDGIIENIEIYDMTGKLMLTANRNEIDVSILPNGIYQVVSRSSNSIRTNQLIIKR